MNKEETQRRVRARSKIMLLPAICLLLSWTSATGEVNLSPDGSASVLTIELLKSRSDKVQSSPELNDSDKEALTD